MKLNIGFQVNNNLNFSTDNSLLLIEEGIKRGHNIFTFTPEEVYYNKGKVYAYLKPTELSQSSNAFIFQQSITADLDDLNIIFIRQDPPFNIRYYTNTLLLEKCSSLIINNPASIRNFPEKLFPLESYMLPTLITEKVEAVKEFMLEYPTIVLKPLYSYGGEGVVKIVDSTNLDTIFEMMIALYQAPIVAQQFCEEVSQAGDKRILMLDGEILGVFKRYNDKNFRSNLKLGALSYKAQLSSREILLTEVVGELLKKNGFLLAGLDFLGEKIIEVNITSPTGMRALNELYNTNVEKKCWDCFEQKLNL